MSPQTRIPAWGVIAVAMFFMAGSARGEQLTKLEQRCANTLNRNGAKLARSVDGEARRCFEDAGHGKLSMSADACMAADRKGKINKRKAKTRAGEEAKCAPPAPAFAYSEAGAANAVAESEALAFVNDVFGTPVEPAVADCNSAPGLCSCQQAVLKTALRIGETRLQVFRKCKQSALRENKLPFASGAVSAAELEHCVDDSLITGSIAADSKGKIARRTAKLVSVIGARLTRAFGSASP
ncbi:MAG: hypothetical protein ACE5D3_04405 [Candidatus Binatia bacterium]